MVLFYLVELERSSVKHNSPATTCVFAASAFSGFLVANLYDSTKSVPLSWYAIRNGYPKQRVRTSKRERRVQN